MMGSHRGGRSRGRATLGKKILAAVLSLLLTVGTLEVLGLDPRRDGSAIRRRLGVVPQADTLDMELTVMENLLIYGRYFDIERHEGRRRAEELLEFVQLADRADSRVDPLSGGQKRRISIARSLINEPDMLLLDEPTTGLDPQARHVLWDKLYQLKERGATLVVTTHFMDEAEQLCDRLVVMDGGRIVAEGSPAELAILVDASGSIGYIGDEASELNGHALSSENIIFHDKAIRQALGEAGCVIVLWTKASVESDWVKDEAAEGKERLTVRQLLCHEAGLYAVSDMVDHGEEMLDWEGITAKLAAATGNAGDMDARNHYAQEALRRADHLTERERFYIEGTYSYAIYEEAERAEAAFRGLLDFDPSSIAARNNLGPKITMASRTACSLGRPGWSSSVLAAISIPGVQIPHCRAACSRNFS